MATATAPTPSMTAEVLDGSRVARWRSYSHDEYLKRGHIAELDGVRALAVLMVITYHIKDDPFSWLSGHLGVTLFFVLSGYLITAIGLREERSRGRVSLSAFYVRRICRICPSYFIVLGLYVIILCRFHLRDEQEILLREYWLGYVLYYQEFVREWTGGRMPFIHSWSLGIEEKFYLAWPAVCFVVCRAAPTRLILGVCGAIALLSMSLCLKQTQLAGLGRCIAPYASILMGCVLALTLESQRGYKTASTLGGRRIQLLLTLALLALQCGAVAAGNAGVSEILYNGVYATVAAGWLASLLVGEGVVQKCLSVGPLVFIGQLSYGIYLIHLLVLTLVTRATERVAPAWSHAILEVISCTVLSVGAAYCLSRAVEQPAIRLGRRWSQALIARKSAALSSAG